jgi:hypothetical protein
MLKSKLYKALFAAVVCSGFAGFSADLALNLESKDGKFLDTGDNKISTSAEGLPLVEVNGMRALQIIPTGSFCVSKDLTKKFLNIGKDSMTFSALVKVEGDKGGAFVMCAGAGDSATPGYRLGATVNDGKIGFYFFLVGKPLSPERFNTLYVNAANNKQADVDKWVCITVAVNREKDASIYINGELAGAGSVAKLAAEDLSGENAVFGAYSHELNGVGVKLDIAKIAVYRGLLSPEEIKQNAGKWLEAVKE